MPTAYEHLRTRRLRDFVDGPYVEARDAVPLLTPYS